MTVKVGGHPHFLSTQNNNMLNNECCKIFQSNLARSVQIWSHVTLITESHCVVLLKSLLINYLTDVSTLNFLTPL